MTVQPPSNRILEHTPEDMTVTVEAGATLAALQLHLAKRGQWLPLDPPAPEKLTIENLLANNASGPRRFGYGTIRDYLIGLKVVLADGRIVKSGGKVVKNVADYDVQKVFIGSRGTLGTIAEATFKLRPRPEAEKFLGKHCDTLPAANAAIEAILESSVTPVVLDLHNSGGIYLVVGFEGTREEVEWQADQARQLGFTEAANLDYEGTFWAREGDVYKMSVLPSKLIEKIGMLGQVQFVARAGNGIVYYRGGMKPAQARAARPTFSPR